MTKNLDSLDPREHIIIKGAKMHNLKNVDVSIPHNKLVVVTGVSGSGKSLIILTRSLAKVKHRSNL